MVKLIVTVKIKEGQEEAFKGYLLAEKFGDDRVDAFTSYALSSRGMNFKSNTIEEQRHRFQSLKDAGFTNIICNPPLPSEEKTPMLLFVEPEELKTEELKTEELKTEELKTEEPKKLLKDKTKDKTKEPKEPQAPNGCRYNSTIIFTILIFAFLGAMLAGWCLFKVPSVDSIQNADVAAIQSDKGQIAIQSGVEKGLSSKPGQIAIQRAVGTIDPELQAKIDQANAEWTKILDRIESK